MAITITPTKLGAVGNRICYQIDVAVGGGTTGTTTATISNATLLADAVAGSPLRALFATAVASTAAAQGLIGGTHSWIISPIVGSAAQMSFAAGPDASAGALIVTITHTLGAAANNTYSWLLEIIFNEVGYAYPHGGPG
jgi:hypothetical protein